METFIQSVKYEVVLGLECFDTRFKEHNHVAFFNSQVCHANLKWQKYAKEFYDITGVYVSAISSGGKAIYNSEWGCPDAGEYTITFHCTANPKFIKDLEKYEEGVLYITKKLKKEFEQNTITITKLPATICYLTDEDNSEG